MRPNRSMRAQLSLVGVVVALGLCVGACGDDQSGPDSEASAGPSTVADAERSFRLPFGLAPPEGTEPVGRPAVYDSVPYYLDGEPVQARSLRAAYRVTGDDPPTVFRQWVAQLDGLAVDEVSIVAGERPGDPWLQAAANGGGAGDWVDLQLWATRDVPVLLVSIDAMGDGSTGPPTTIDDAGSPPPPAAAEVGGAERVAGDALFSEQGDVIHLPQGTRALMATLPTASGTGGSTSVLAADDGDTAVRAMLDEATAIESAGVVGEPVHAESDGVDIVTADFVIEAGGWSFDLVSVRGPHDDYATVYVTSSAD